MSYYTDTESDLPPWRDPRDDPRRFPPPPRGVRVVDVNAAVGRDGVRRASFGHTHAQAPRPEPFRERRPSFGGFGAPRPEPLHQRRPSFGHPAPATGFRVVDVSPPRQRRPSFGQAPRPEAPRPRRPSFGPVPVPRPEQPQRRPSKGQAEESRPRRQSLTRTLKDLFLGSRDRHRSKSRDPTRGRWEPKREKGREHGRENGRERGRDRRRDGISRPPITMHGRPPRPPTPPIRRAPEPRRQEAPRPKPRRHEPPRPASRIQFVDASWEPKTEGIERYRERGNFPTHIGDRFGQNDRYRVVHKLGNGSFGIAWLIEDTKDRRQPWKAIKINDASPGGESEVKLQKVFERAGYTGQKALDKQVAVPYDLFWIMGPNGRHLCTVLPILGPTLESVVQDRKNGISRCALVHQVMMAAHFLHVEMEMMHGDFRCGNIMVQIDGLQSLTESELMDVYGGRPTAIKFRDLPGSKLTSAKHAPSYLVVNANLNWTKLNSLVVRKTGKKAISESRPKVAVADLGSAKHRSMPKPWEHITPLSMTDPIVYFGGSAGYYSDIFSMGVAIFEIMVGGSSQMLKRNKNSCRKPWEHYFPCIEECIGPLPVNMRKNILDYKHDFVKQQFPRGFPPDFQMFINPEKPVFRPQHEYDREFQDRVGSVKGAKNIPHGLLLKHMNQPDADLCWHYISWCCQWRPGDRGHIQDLIGTKEFKAWSSAFRRGRSDKGCVVQ